MTGNYIPSADRQLSLKDDEFIIGILKQARDADGRMPYELRAIDRAIDRIEQRRRQEVR